MLLFSLVYTTREGRVHALCRQLNARRSRAVRCAINAASRNWGCVITLPQGVVLRVKFLEKSTCFLYIHRLEISLLLCADPVLRAASRRGRPAARLLSPPALRTCTASSLGVLKAFGSNHLYLIADHPAFLRRL